LYLKLGLFQTFRPISGCLIQISTRVNFKTD